MPEIDAILFDLGGTLVDYPTPSWPVAVGRCLEGAYAYLVRPEHEQPPRVAEVPDPREAGALRGRAAPDTPPAHRVMLALRQVIRSLSGRTLPRMAEACARPLLAASRLYDDAMPTILALEKRGYLMGLVSNTPWGTPEYLWESQVKRFALEPHFPVRCFSSVVGFRKPDPRIFRAAVEQTGVPAARTLFVGNDPEADIAGARAAGMRTAFIRRRGSPAPREAPAADLTVEILTELLDHLPGRVKKGRKIC